MKMPFFNSTKKSSGEKPVQKLKRQGINPERDWKIIFVLFIFLNICLLGFHGFLFYRISEGGFFEIPEADSEITESIDMELLESTLKDFSEREAELLEKVSSPDPAPEAR
ncbi:MAG: hypothetical protein U5L75_02900 [Candidatus Campbellbacteria bacterium]|nr:hypothetical protein [Candidatus Campbellbacteria bacterium]